MSLLLKGLLKGKIPSKKQQKITIEKDRKSLEDRQYHDSSLHVKNRRYVTNGIQLSFDTISIMS